MYVTPLPEWDFTAPCYQNFSDFLFIYFLPIIWEKSVLYLFCSTFHKAYAKTALFDISKGTDPSMISNNLG